MLFGKKKKGHQNAQDPPVEANEELMDGAADEGEDDVRGGAPVQDEDPGGWDGPIGGDEGAVQADGPAGDESPEEPSQEDPEEGGAEPDGGEDPEQDLAASFASPEDGPRPKKARKKPARERKPKAERPPRAPMSEAQKQTVFTCGCVTAGFCAVLLVIFGTAMACRMFSAKARPVLAAPVDVPDGVYYDQAGRMHVNVYMTSAQDREIKVYVDKDGNVTTKMPEGQPQDLEPIILYVDGDGNITSEPPKREPEAPAEPEPFRTVMYLDGEGNLSKTKPASGPWRQVDIEAAGGGVKVTTGEVQGLPEGDPGAHAQPKLAGPVDLFVLPDGTITPEDPGKDAGATKYTLSTDESGEVQAVRTADVPQTDDPGR